MNHISKYGGGADHEFTNCPVAYKRDLHWKDDIADPECLAEQLVGELMHECLSESLVYDTNNASVNEYIKRNDIEDVTAQYFASRESKKRVRVYHSNTQLFVGVECDGYGGDHPTWNFFSTMEMVDFVSMLQPNATEVYVLMLIY